MPVAITVTRDSEDPALFHVKGRRVSGRVRASIHFAENSNSYGIRENGEPSEWVLASVAMNAYRPSEDDPEVLTINGVAYDGFRSGRINDPWRPNVRHDGGFHRVDDWNGKVSDSALEVWWEVADQVADLFGTDEAIHAARLRKASDAVDKAETELYEAQGNKDRADEHLATLRRKGPQPITRPRNEERPS